MLLSHCHGIKPGNIKMHHECGEIFQVEVLRIERKSCPPLDGSENWGDHAFLRRLEDGFEFDVWASDNAGGYAGWHLLDY